MAGKREEKRDLLRQKLIEAARARVVGGGISSLRARDVTKDAGCGLGTLYSAFKDLDDLVLYLNTETFHELGACLDQYTSKHESPREKLIALARGYIAFAYEHRNLWEALFDYKFADDLVLPDWHLVEVNKLMDRISDLLSGLFPELEEQGLMLRSKTLFSAVHGIVSISMQERFVAVPREGLEVQLVQFVEAALIGFEGAEE